MAIFEAAKGILVIAAALALFEWVNADAQRGAEDLVRHFHLNPASHYPRILLSAASHLTGVRMLSLALGALLYSGLRFAEAYGLWHGRTWAWGFGLASAAFYVPFELAHLSARVDWAGLTVLLTNVLILIMLLLSRRA